MALQLLDGNSIRQNIKLSFQKAIEWTHSEAFSIPYHAACPVAGAAANDYLYRIQEYGNGEHIIWGIHFEGRNIFRPYVSVFASTFDPAECAVELAAVAAKEFKVFTPGRIAFFGRPGLRFEVDTTCYATSVGTARTALLPDNYRRVQVHRLADIAFYAEYEEFYSQVYTISPEHPSSKETRESLQRAVDEETMFRIIVDNEYAGFLGLHRSTDRYLNGYYVIEEILAPKFRGQKLAASVQRHVIEQLADRSALYFGHIDQRNIASWRAALSVGRQPIYSAYWYPITR
jgi:RimJ/RimL family protein N-acetyltransferase